MTIYKSINQIYASNYIQYYKSGSRIIEGGARIGNSMKLSWNKACPNGGSH